MGIIVYPPSIHQTTSPTIFFIGSANNSCTINGKNIELVYAGNFCPVFDLELGENVFLIDLDGERLEYKVNRRHCKEPEATKQSQTIDRDVALRAHCDDKPVSKICLDPGHGGSARGTCSPKGLAEKDLNLSLARALKMELENSGKEVFLTRDADIDVSLAERVKIAEANNCDLFISIHHNAIPDYQNPLEHRGISVHYYYDENIPLAEKLLAALIEATALPSAGIIKQNLHVLRENTKIPAVLIEFGYLIHPEESEIIFGVDFQKKAAQAFKILNF